MKKIIILMTAALLVTGVTFADHGGKGKAKKTCTKGDACCKKNSKTAKM